MAIDFEALTTTNLVLLIIFGVIALGLVGFFLYLFFTGKMTPAIKEDYTEMVAIFTTAIADGIVTTDELVNLLTKGVHTVFEFLKGKGVTLPDDFPTEITISFPTN